jgi:hypothetical protein
VLVIVVMAGRGPVVAVPVASLFVSDSEAVGSCGADRVPAAFVFVVGGDVADGFVESHGIVATPTTG